MSYFVKMAVGFMATTVAISSIRMTFAEVVIGAEPPRTILSGQVELPRLVDLCAERLGLNIEYDAAALRGTVTLRLGAGVSDEELWLLTNRVLASRGFTSVQMPGEDMLSIVRLPDAPGMARLEHVDVSGQAGFVTVVTRVEHQPVRQVIDAVKLVMSRTGSAATALGDGGLLLLSDLKPRIDEAMRVIDLIDVPMDLPLIEKIPARNLAATQLATLATSASATRDSMTPRPMRGKLTPVPDGNAIILIAPPNEAAYWRELIARFDEREAVLTRGYAPQQFGVGEVSRLIEQSVRTPAPRGSGERWRVVTDELTGTLLVTATPSEHEQIQELLDRLESTSREARRPVRAFPIRNRNAREMIDVLSKLLDAGMFDDVAESPSMDPAVRTTSATVNPSTQSALAGSSLRRDRLRMHLTADENTNTLIAIGDARMLEQLDHLIRTLDQRQPQVMIEVLVISLSDSQALDLGIELQKFEITGDTLIQLSSLFGLGVPSPTATTLPAGGRGFTGVALSPGDFSVLLRALQSINRGRSLTMPKVLVNNNQTAMVDSVLQEPFTSLNALDTVATTSFGGTLDAGTIVTVVPQITEADHLTLEYSVSISSFVGESADPALPPPRQQNRLQSIVTIPDGYTVVLGGLEVTSDAQAINQVPLIGSIPFLGEAFKSRSKSQSRQRFFVFIRSNILRQTNFEDLKYLSDLDAFEMSATEIMSDWPTVHPRIIN